MGKAFGIYAVLIGAAVAVGVAAVLGLLAFSVLFCLGQV